jgi:hypothetical protein
MKTIFLLLALSVSVIAANAQVAKKEVKLIGITSGLDKNTAILEIRAARRPTDDVILKEGQALNGVQVAKIEAAGGTVNVTVDGETRTLALEADKDRTNTMDKTSPTIQFRSVPLDIAISLYADYKNRTVMQHPQLGHPTFSLDVSPNSKEEAAAIFEKMFSDQSIATIPDGEHFVMVVPFALTNAVKPRSAALSSTTTVVPEASVIFRTAPIALVLPAYADWVQKDVVNLHDGSLPLGQTVTFVQTTPLSREELCYALETQNEWRNIRLVPAGDKWKFEQITESK